MNYAYTVVTWNGKQVYEHRLVWESVYGPIPKGFQVHHKNGNKQDNRLENLEVVKHGDHIKEHRVWDSKGRVEKIKSHFANIEPVEVSCAFCGDNFSTRPHPAHGPSMFCSKSCRSKHHYRLKRAN